MKILNILTYVFITVILSINVLGVKAMDNIKSNEKNGSFQAFKIKKFLDNGLVLLGNGEEVKLKGIDMFSISSENKMQLKKLLLKKYVVFVRDDYGEHNEGYLYLLDKDNGFFPKNMLSSDPDGRGFLNVRKGFGNVKGFAYNINVALIKLGYAKVDHSTEFEYKKEFIEYKKHVSQ